jgi:E3 ubiquitin-protein ligase ZNF598
LTFLGSDLCTRNKKVFTHEHELFTIAQLRKHEKHGDDTPGAIDQSGFKGHPECEFCHERFYGDDELYTHCRDKHERCHICDRQPNNRQHQYYINYDALEEHFQKDHFLCLDKECLDKKFVVFESEMDLKAHQLESHPNGLSKDARRDARTVDIATFDYRAPYQPQRQRRGGREGRGAGRGRDPNADSLPVSSAQPLRRDELAYQRQMAIQSAQSVSTRSFGGQLTSRETPVTRAPAGPTPSQAARMASPAPPVTAAVQNLTLNNAPVGSLSPQDQARQLRHAAVVERASNLLQNDASKLSDFRTRVSNYRASTISANDLIDSFFSLFDTPTSELGKLIKELAEIYEDQSKKTGLLSAWNNWRAINEDYPALAGPSGTLPGLSSSTLGSGGKRVLRLKSSTAQSSRSAVGRAGSLSSSPFPPLSTPTTNRAAAAAAPTWTSTPATRPSVTTTSSYARPAPRASTGPAPRTADRNAFPALPAAPKPNTLMAGLTRGTVRWDDRRGQAPAAWGSENAGSGASTPGDIDEPGASSGGKKGKGKKGKQVLFQFG